LIDIGNQINVLDMVPVSEFVEIEIEGVILNCYCFVCDCVL